MSKKQKVDLFDLILNKSLFEFERELDQACEASQDSNFILRIADQLRFLQDIVSKKSVVPFEYDKLEIKGDCTGLMIHAQSFKKAAWYDTNVNDFKECAGVDQFLSQHSLYIFMTSGHRFQKVHFNATSPINPIMIEMVALLFDGDSKGSASELFIHGYGFDLHEHARFKRMDFSSLKKLRWSQFQQPDTRSRFC